MKYTANKKINNGSITTTESTGKPPKLTSDIIADYLDRMGGSATLVKPDGTTYNPDRKGRVVIGDRMTTAEKFAQSPDVGLNNEFTKLPEVHARFDDRRTALQVQKEIATGKLTTQKFFEVPTKEVANQAADEIRSSPEIKLGRGENIEVRQSSGGFEVVAVKQYQPIPSRGNTLARTYGLNNDPTGAYVAFNKPEESYKAPLSLKELQAESRRLETSGTKAIAPDTRTEFKPQVQEGWQKVELPTRSPIADQIIDHAKAISIAPMQSPEPASSKTSLKIDPDRIGGYDISHADKIEKLLQNEQNYRSVLGMLNPIEQDKFNVLIENLDSGDRAAIKEIIPYVNKARLNTSSFGGGLYNQDSRQTFAELDRSIGKQIGFNNALERSLPEFVSSSDRSLRVDIGDQANIEISRMNVGDRNAFRIDNIVAYDPAAVGDRFTMKTLKYLQQNLPDPVVMGNVVNTKLKRIFEKQGYTKVDGDYLPPELVANKLAIVPEPQSRLNNTAIDSGGWANAQGESLVTSENIAQKRVELAAERAKFLKVEQPFNSQRQAEVDRFGGGKPMNDQAAYDLAKNNFETIKRTALDFPDTFQGVDQSAKFPSLSNLKRQALSEGIMLADSGTKAFQAYASAKAKELTGTLKVPESGLPVTARLGQEYISPKTGAVGTVSAVGKTGVKMVDSAGEPIRIAGAARPEVIPYETLERLKYTGNKDYGFSVAPALRPAFGAIAAGTLGAIAFKQLAKSVGLTEEQQNIAAGVGGVTGALSGGSLSLFKPTTELKVPTAQQFARGVMGIPVPSESGMFLSADGRNNMRMNQLKQYDIKPVLSEAAIIATDMLSPSPYGIATVPAMRTTTELWQQNFNDVAERGIAGLANRSNVSEAIAKTRSLKDLTYQSLTAIAKGAGLPFPMTEQIVGNVVDRVPSGQEVMDMADRAKARLAKRFGLNSEVGAIYSAGGDAPTLSELTGDRELTREEFAKKFPDKVEKPVDPRVMSGADDSRTLAQMQGGEKPKLDLNKVLEFNQRYESGEIKQPKYSLSPNEELGRRMTPEEFARRFPDKAKDFKIEVDLTQPRQPIFTPYEPKQISKELKRVILQDFQVGQEVISTGKKGFQGRVADVKDGQVTFENYQGKQKTFTLEAASASVAPVEYRQPLILDDGYDYRQQRMPKEAIAPLPKDFKPLDNKAPSNPDRAGYKAARKVADPYFSELGYKVTYNDRAAGIMQIEPPDFVPAKGGKLLSLNEYRAKATEWRREALAVTEPIRSLDYHLPLADKAGRTALEQAIYEANQSLPPAPIRDEFMVDPPKQKLKEFLSRGSKPYVPESMANAESLKQAMTQAEALGDIESQMNIAKQLEKVQSKRVVKKVSGGGFSKAKQVIPNVAEVAMDVVYQPSRAPQPKQSNFIAESTVEAAAKSSGASTAQVKAQIANQRATGQAPDLAKATEAAKPIEPNRIRSAPETTRWNEQSPAFEKDPKWRSQSSVIAATKSVAPLTIPEAPIKQSEANRLSTPAEAAAKPRSLPSSTIQAFEGSNAAFKRNISQPKTEIGFDEPFAVSSSQSKAKISDRITKPFTTEITGRTGMIGDRAIKTFGIAADATQAVEAFNKSVGRGESGAMATTRAVGTVGSVYGGSAAVGATVNLYNLTSLGKFAPIPAPFKAALMLAGGIAAAAGADDAISNLVGVDKAKQDKYQKDMSKLGLAVDPVSEQFEPFGKAEPDRQTNNFAKTGEYIKGASNLAASSTVGLIPQIATSVGRSLAELSNKQSIENARYLGERDTSIKAGMDAKSNRSIAYEDRGDGVTVGYGRNKGYNATESRVLALQNLANEHGYEVPRTGHFESKTLYALEKLGYTQSQITNYIQGKTNVIGKPPEPKSNQQQAKDAFALRAKLGKAPTSAELSQALSDERKKQGLKGGEMLSNDAVSGVYSNLASGAGRTLSQLQGNKVGGVATRSALRLGAGIR